MRKKKKKIKVQYEFLIEYEHEDHFNKFIEDLKKEPIYECGGAGTASDKQVYSYNCKRIGGGIIINKGGK